MKENFLSADKKLEALHTKYSKSLNELKEQYKELVGELRVYAYKSGLGLSKKALKKYGEIN